MRRQAGKLVLAGVIGRYVYRVGRVVMLLETDTVSPAVPRVRTEFRKASAAALAKMYARVGNG